MEEPKFSGLISSADPKKCEDIRECVVICSKDGTSGNGDYAMFRVGDYETPQGLIEAGKTWFKNNQKRK